MKRYGNIFDSIISIENLREAHRNASRGKKSYRQVRKINKKTDFYLYKIQNMLKNGTYRVSKYRLKIINDKGKQRELYKLPYYPDRIIQWAIMLQIENILVKTFCYHTCASIAGRGINRAVKLSKKYTAKSNDCRYCLKFDIKKFYPSIDQTILKNMLRKKFKDKRLLSLLDLIIDSFPQEKGIPIGSYLSQYLANFYLTYFDHWLKETMLCKYVVRYMDDICVYSDNKADLHYILKQSQEYLAEKLNLIMKENYQIFPTRIRGVDFVGYRFFGTFTLLRKRIALRYKRKVIKLSKKPITAHSLSSFFSYFGFTIPANTKRFFKKNLQNLFTKMKTFIFRQRMIKRGYVPNYEPLH
jgi:RNA-directed DNA polymerase